MSRKFLIMYYLIMAIFGGIVGSELGKRDYKIEKLTKENKLLHKEKKKLEDNNNYLAWQLGEVPTIIESHKEEICRE